jgi:acetoin utilization deacetylase AcuC-like enzyme
VDSSALRIPLVSHRDLARLHPTDGHPESPERLRVLQEAFPQFVEARRATVEEIAACHDRGYVELVRSLADEGRTVMLDADTVLTPSSYDAALLAAGAAIQAVECDGFALVRPPGHHALPARAMGFCFFDNIAVAVRFAQRELGLGRVAILDWDVHHGNGTETIFWNDSSVLFVSLHQWPFYPGSGGPGEGSATTVNVPLPAGSTDDAYLAAMATTVVPAIVEFAPDMLVISAGFDAARGDPLGGMLVSEDGFRELATRARGLCDRVALVLEGGYDVQALPRLVGATLSAL